jgi:CheY-like chemotaxis protein
VARGHRVLTAHNANEALLHLESASRIDLLFTDIVMPPGMNGVELAARARQTHKDLRVLLTSGFAGHAVAHGVEIGTSCRMLAKPYRPADLARHLAALLGPPPRRLVAFRERRAAGQLA